MAVYKNMAEYEEKVHRWKKKFPDDMRNAVHQLAWEVHKEVVWEHLNGKKMAKGVGSRHSATLGIKTGALRNSIGVKTMQRVKGVIAWIGTFRRPLKYAKLHEYGLGEMPERSFLRSSIDAKKEEIAKVLGEKVKDSYTDA